MTVLNPPGSTESTFGHTRPALLAKGMGITVQVDICTRIPALAALNAANNSDPAAIRAVAWLSPDDIAAISSAIASRLF